jgi:glycerate kinase
MPLRVLIAPDKFKGTLTAEQAARAIAKGWRSVRREDEIELLPISDGGEGFGTVMAGSLNARERKAYTVDAAHHAVTARWWWSAKSRTAIIESAEVIGLARLPAGRFHPFELDTFGLGAVLIAAAKQGAQRWMVGIGGSATNDGGFGLARALGWQFEDRQGHPILNWRELTRLHRVAPPRWDWRIPGLVVAADVKSPLLGVRGATHIYGPQKGIKPADIALAESCLRRLAQVVRLDPGLDFARRPGAGAAGGLGFGLMTFCGARIREGFGLFARHSGLERRLRFVDLVITGEGAVDVSTSMGKGAGEIARLCRRMRKPCLCLAGTVKGGAKVRGSFHRILAMTDLVSAEESMAEPAHWLEAAAATAAQFRMPNGRQRTKDKHGK